MAATPTMQVFDKNFKRTGTLIDSYDIERTRRINSDYEITFMVPMASDDYQEKIQLKGHVRDERGQFYVIQSRSRSRESKKLIANIYCNHIMFKLIDFKFPYESYIDEAYGIHITQLTDLITAATGGRFTFIVDDTFALHDVKDWGRGNCLEALNDIIEMYECEVEPDNFVIHLKKQIGSDVGLQYRLKKNVVSSSFKDITENLVTRMFGLMEQDRTIIGMDASVLTDEELDLLSQVPGAIVDGKIAVSYLISPYASFWGSDSVPFHDGELKNRDLSEPEDLLEAMRNSLREKELPELDITISTADLFKIDNTEPQPHLGDIVTCIDPKMDMNKLKVRITELIEYPYNRDKHSQPTISNVKPRDYNDIIADLQKSKNIVDDMFSNGKIRTDIFEAATKQAIIDINNSKTELIYPPEGGILAQDKTNALNQVRLTSAGLGISTDGWKTVRSAVTARGITGELIIGQIGNFDSLSVGSGNEIILLNHTGLSAGNASFNSAPFRVDMAGNLVANKLTANSAQINSSNLNGSTWKDGYFSGNVIVIGELTGGILTGATIRTAITGERIVLAPTGFDFYDNSNVRRVTLGTNQTFNISGHTYLNPSQQPMGLIYAVQNELHVIGNNNLRVGTNSGGTVTLQGPVNFTSSVSGLSLGIDQVSGLQSILNSLQLQISSLQSTFYSHTHQVTTANHNHGNPQNQPNTGGGTYTTTTP